MEGKETLGLTHHHHDKVARLFHGLRPRSQHSLTQALDIASTDGVGATLIVQIPPGRDKPPEVYISTAPSHLVTDLWRAGSG